jgi:hypothetical protein
VTPTAARVAVAWAVAWAVGLLPAARPAAAQRAAPPRPDSTYETETLRALVGRAAARALAPRAYVAWTEQEAATFRERDDGRVVPQVIQQTQGLLRWHADTGAEQRSAAARAETYELDPAGEQGLRAGWTMPLLVGDRFRLRQPAVATPNGLERMVLGTVGAVATALDTVEVVHPLAKDRERVYRYAGGDTLPLVLDDGSAVSAVRIRVRPVGRPPEGSHVFTGEVWVEAVSGLVRRLVGRVDRVRSDAGRARAFLTGDVEPLAYLDAQGIVLEDRALASRVHIEVRARAFAREGASVVRRVSTTWYESVDAGPAPQPVTVPPFRLVPGLSAPARGWRMPLGEATSPVAGSDARFMPWWPERERPTGPAIGLIEVRRETDLYHYNRVEGVFTGSGLTVRLRDRLPGAVLRLVGGWAWNERTFRGRGSFTRTAGGTSMFLGAGRFLDLTNDFRSPYDSGSTWGPFLLSQDPYDYVDRRYARLGVETAIPDADAVVRLEAGLVDDRSVRRSVTGGLFGGDFLPNRPVDPGLYGRGIALVEWQRNADLDPTRRRIGVVGRVEFADGDLTYQRIEGRVVARTRFGPGTLAAVGHAGAVLGQPPAQQLFELGAQQHLPGYAYKEFAGDRAAVLDVVSAVPFGVLDEPIGEVAGVVVPPLAPALQIGLSAGWTDLVSPFARAAAARLGAVFDPLTGVALRDAAGLVRTPRATGNVRTTINVGVQFFGGALYVGAGRAVDTAADAPRVWRAVIAFGRLL